MYSDILGGTGVSSRANGSAKKKGQIKVDNENQTPKTDWHTPNAKKSL